MTALASYLHVNTFCFIFVTKPKIKEAWWFCNQHRCFEQFEGFEPHIIKNVQGSFPSIAPGSLWELSFKKKIKKIKNWGAYWKWGCLPFTDDNLFWKTDFSMEKIFMLELASKRVENYQLLYNILYSYK